MVKRKRTLSTKEISDCVSRGSDGDGGEETKRLKTHDASIKAVGGVEGPEGVPNTKPSHAASTPSDPLGPTANATGAHSSSTPAITSQQPQPSNVPPSDPPSTSAQPQHSAPSQHPAPQLRISARVLNKHKQRREETSKADPPSSTSVATNKKQYGTGPERKGCGEGKNRKKRRRPWKLWSLEDKNSFFESINECGKDFEAIQNYLTTKLKKKGGSQVKDKDQVRHFYYRTWHKISKHITFNEGVKKATQELYGLINFGELRKKIGGTLDEKKAQKLQELIRKGYTSVRVKGKSLRVRTPICRALKKLNQIDEHREPAEPRVPATVTIELVPASMSAWCHVQGVAHNPRVRLTTSLQRPLSSLISHLQNKWRSPNLKMCDTICSRVNFPLEIKPQPEQMLRIFPAKGTVIKPIAVQPEMLVKSSFVSLSSHEARLRRRGEKVGRSEQRKNVKQLGQQQQQQQKDTEEKGHKDSGGTRGEARGVAGPGEGKGRGRCGMKMEDSGDVSQEEHEDCTDCEVCFPNSSDEEIVKLSQDKATKTITKPHCIQIKEEPPDPDVDFPSSPSAKSELRLDPNVQVKEEGEEESGDTLRQLMALETVAGAGAVDGDADVVCTGESTRLAAHVASESHQKTSQHHAAQGGSSEEEERGAAATPEPKEEERQPAAEAVVTPEVDLEVWMQRVRSGWTLASAGSITVGVLYLIMGQNKKIFLEYEFEDEKKVKQTEESSNAKDEEVAADNSTSTTTTPTTTTTTASTTTTITTTTTNTTVLKYGLKTEAANEKEQQQPPDKEGTGSEEEDTKNTEAEETHATAENLTGMLAQLLAMTRMMLTKPTTDTTCPCGHICGRNPGVLRSPAGGRLMGRSPSSTRSPRNSRLAAASSPGGANTKSPRGQAGVTPRPPRDRNKPASAKKLMAESPDPAAAVQNDATGVGSGVGTNSTETSIQPSTLTTTLTTTAVSTPDAVQVSIPGMGTGASAVIPGMRVVLGTVGEAGEFKVPIAPVPRQQQQQQQANFNAQLSKLLPRYNNRPGRRVVRKNVVVQRQLPLLPKPSLALPAVNKNGGKRSGYIPFTIIPAHPGTVASPTNTFTARLPTISSSPSHIHTPLLSPSLLPVQAKVLQPMPLASSKTSTSNLLQPIQIPSTQGVAVSQVQVSVLSPQHQQTAHLSTPQAPHTTQVAPTPNAISVNISGQPLLTVEMPPMVSTHSTPIESAPQTTLHSTEPPAPPHLSVSVQPPAQPSAPAALSLPPAPVSTSAISIPDDLSVSCPVTSAESSKANSLLSSVVSQVLSEFPDLSTPPSTPGPSKSPEQQLETPLLCRPSSPPLLFSPALPVEPLSSLHTQTLHSSMSASLPQSLPSGLSPTLSQSPSLLTLATTGSLKLSPTPTETNAFSSLLNTPTPTTVTYSSNLSTAVRNIFPSTPSISSLLPSSPLDLSKGFPNLLGGSEETQDGCILQDSGGLVPELHIPDGNVSLPVFDISLGGTVTIADQQPGALVDSSGPQPTLGEQLAAAAARSPPQTTSDMPLKAPLTSSPIMSLSSTAEDSAKTDKLDISLGACDSNSSFSSLLAAATQPQFLQTSLIEASTGASSDCIGGAGGQGLRVCDDAGAISGGSGLEADTAGFPNLSNTLPSPPSSPSRLLQQSDNQWLNNEVNDFSLSSFLGHFESPIKNNSNSRGSSQAAPQTTFMPSLSSVYNENSVDFTATFAEMKAQVSGSFKE